MVNKTDFNAKITEVKGKIPSISGLATSSALTAVENKIPDISRLATCSALTTVKNKIPDVTGLITKTDFDSKLKGISDRVTKNKSKHLLVENELTKLKSLDLSYFRGKNYFEESGSVVYLIFQPINKYFLRIVAVGNGEYISFWKSRGFSDENINSITASNHMITPSLDYVGTKIRVKFNGSCLKQDKITYDHKNIVNIYIVCEKSKNYNISSYPTLENCLFGAASLTKNADIDQYKYFGYGIGFDRLGEFSFHILVLGKDFIQGINGTTIYAEKNVFD